MPAWPLFTLNYAFQLQVALEGYIKYELCLAHWFNSRAFILIYSAEYILLEVALIISSWGLQHYSLVDNLNNWHVSGISVPLYSSALFVDLFRVLEVEHFSALLQLKLILLFPLEEISLFKSSCPILLRALFVQMHIYRIGVFNEGKRKNTVEGEHLFSSFVVYLVAVACQKMEASYLLDAS